MKNIYILLILSLCSCVPMRAASSVDSVLTAAEAAYNTERYTEAAEMIESFLVKHPSERNFTLCYNLGNAYYRTGQMGKAILNYERALRYKPEDQATKHNLILANSQTVDRFDYTRPLLSEVWHTICYTPTATLSVTLAILFALLTIASVLLFLLSAKQMYRRVGFYTAISALLLTILFLFVVRTRTRDFFDKSQAIVLVGQCTLRSAPENAANMVTAIGEGAKVTLSEQRDAWVYIETPDGKNGWVKTEQIETIATN